MKTRSTTIRETKSGKIQVRVGSDWTPAPPHMTREEVLNLICKFPVGTVRRNEKIREAIKEVTIEA